MLTCAWLHLFLAPRIAVGAFELVQASKVQENDLFAVVTDPENPAAGVTVVKVDAVEEVEAEGMYLPVITRPFLIANDVVTPL